jgi:isopropylmalate/homocitrate/citramalate synthase
MLADTVGWANPEDVKRRIGAVRDLSSDIKIGLHLHDTRGMGAANVYAALEMGVDMFDSSVAGLGGCPFAAHANVHGAGNVCTEDMVYMCEEMGIDTGIDLDALLLRRSPSAVRSPACRQADARRRLKSTVRRRRRWLSPKQP